MAASPTEAGSEARDSNGALIHADMTVVEADRVMRQAFRQAAAPTPDIDARYLLAGITGVSATDLLMNPHRLVGASAEALARAVARRVAHEPVARILGQRDFYGRTFEVTPDVLDPRADTETIVDLALDLVRQRGLDAGALRIADIGTGSGALIVTLLAELPSATGVAIDISPEALAVAARNGAALGVGHRMTTCVADVVPPDADRFDLVVSNPPYIRHGDIAGLSPDVSAFDPHLALDGGADGLDVYRKIANKLSTLRGNAVIVLEAGAGQSQDIISIFQAVGCRSMAERRDLGGVVRAVALEIHS